MTKAPGQVHNRAGGTIPLSAHILVRFIFRKGKKQKQPEGEG